MGIPGILKEIGKGERIALSKLAVQHLETNKRPLRIAIDAAIWSFQNQAAQGGKNPTLRTLFYRLLKLLALPIQPVFVYDGKNKPLMKRNKTVRSYGTNVTNEMSKKMIQAFRMPCHMAPGEAEAECAHMQKKGIVDAVMSQDVDAIMFGSSLTLRDWSKEAARGNKSATHVSALKLPEIKTRTGLDPAGMILVALLSGGDYDTDGISGFGPGLSCEIAKAGFGSDLLDLMRDKDTAGLQDWRDRLNLELETNQSGYFRTKHNSIKVPQDFPDPTILSYYTNPAISNFEQLHRLKHRLQEAWSEDLDIMELRHHVADVLDWNYKSGARKVIRTLAPALLAHRLLRGQGDKCITSVDQIKQTRKDFVTDGLPELRVEYVPIELVQLDLNAEEDRPIDSAQVDAEELDDDEGEIEATTRSDDGPELESQVLASPKKQRKSPPWDPFAVEKVWISEAIVRTSLPRLVEQWHQQQQEILNDPKKFAVRKCPPTKAATKPTDKSMRQGALEGFLVHTKHTTQPSTDQTSTAAATKQPGVSDQSRDMHTRSRPERTKVRSAAKVNPGSPSKKPRRTNATSQELMSSQLPVTKSVSSSKRDEEADGTSWSQSLVIMSSARSIETSPASQDPADKMLPSVTLRKHGKRAIRSPPDDSTARTRGPDITQFFPGPRKARHTAIPQVDPEHSNLPPERTTGLVSTMPLLKIAAVPRSSLPGTWQETVDADVSLITELDGDRMRRPRISYIDLTGED